MSVKTFTQAQVKEHNKPDDLWFIIHDKVYDATKFLNEHPGGEEVLIENAGKNATTDFDEAGHSLDAKELMKTYYIGDIVDEEKVENKTAEKPKKSKNCLIAVSALAVALGGIVLYKGFRMSKSN